MIAAYQRISRADGDLGKDGKDKSNSIFDLAILGLGTKEIAMIENVFVHDGGRIVVRFKYEQSIQDTVKALQTG